MVSKCANPACGEPFIRFTGGRLFGTEHLSWDHSKSTEFFWLCDRCARTMTLTFDPDHLPVTVATDRPVCSGKRVAA